MAEKCSNMELWAQDEPIVPRRLGSNRADVPSDTRNRFVHGSGSVGTLNTAVEPAAATVGFGLEQAGAMKQQEKRDHF